MNSREVEYQSSNSKDVSSSLATVTMTRSLLFFHWVNLRKFPETSGKSPENSEDGGKVFTPPTNRKHFPLHGQFGLAAPDYMYGK
jgi:hypothetical protein